jgi:hypothetical protein
MSVYPPTRFLTFGPWIYLVPQYKPTSVLMLGYADGSTAGLIRLFYGDVPITGVDIEPLEQDRYGVTFVQQDAQEFIKTCGKYDAVVVDLFPGGEYDPCGFITSQEFVSDLKRIANYIIINTLKEPDMSAYNGLHCIGVNKPAGCANKIYYYEVNKIPDLHPFRS